MLSWFFDAWSFVTSAVQFVFALGAGGLAVLAWGARFHPAVKWPVTEIAILAFGACVAVSAWSWSGIAHDQRQELLRAQRDLARMEETMRRQAALRAEYEAVAARQSELAQERAQSLIDMQEIVDDYEDALASGGAGACAADDAYSRAMRSIRIIGPVDTKTTIPDTGPSDTVPRSRPER